MSAENGVPAEVKRDGTYCPNCNMNGSTYHLAIRILRCGSIPTDDNKHLNEVSALCEVRKLASELESEKTDLMVENAAFELQNKRLRELIPQAFVWPDSADDGIMRGRIFLLYGENLLQPNYNLYCIVEMKKTYEYRIYPTDEQKVLLSKHFGHCRWMYNYALSRKISHYKQTTKTLSRYDIQAEIPVLKKQESTEWLKEVNLQSLQAVLIHLDTAYNKFFTKSGWFPKFKNRKSKQSFEIPKNLTANFDSGYIEIPKFKEPIRTVFHRQFVGEFRT